MIVYTNMANEICYIADQIDKVGCLISVPKMFLFNYVGLCRSFCTTLYCQYFRTQHKQATCSKLRVVYNV